MRPDEKMHDTHEFGCGRGLFYDLECSCWDGPRVTEQDLQERAAGLEPMPRYEPLDMTVSNPKVLPFSVANVLGRGHGRLSGLSQSRRAAQ